MSRIQINNPGSSPEDNQEAGMIRKEISLEDTDSLLDEIDDLLENNAEEFVRSYVQKGGQ